MNGTSLGVTRRKFTRFVCDRFAKIPRFWSGLTQLSRRVLVSVWRRTWLKRSQNFGRNGSEYLDNMLFALDGISIVVEHGN